MDLIELPRLQLTFSGSKVHSYITHTHNPASRCQKRAVNMQGRLYCQDHNGLFLSNYRSELLKKVLSGLPSACVLENAEHELFVLLPSCMVARPVIAADPMSTKVVFDRGSEVQIRVNSTHAHA